MLEISDDEDVVQTTWEKVDLKANLPKGTTDFYDHYGTVPSQRNSRRAYTRFFLRGKGILQWKEKQFGVFTADASRQGLKFLSPIQLLPQERCRIRLPKTKEFQIEIVRCCRIEECCYECGAVFVLGTLTTGRDASNSRQQ